MRNSPASFDAQADSFDDRAGLSAATCEAVSLAVIEESARHGSGMILEIGAGTGEIGSRIAAHGVRYLGLDLSLPMLEHFESRACVAQADADRAWPLRDATVSAVFGSRSLHLLSPEHVAAEAARVASHGGLVVLVGHVERDERAVRAIMRRRMHELLRERGWHPRGGESGRRRLALALEARGATPMAPRVVAQWPVAHSPRLSIESWERTGGLGGVTPGASAKAEILEELRAFGAATYGGLDAVVASSERYVLEGVVLQGTALPSKVLEDAKTTTKHNLRKEP